MRTDILTICIPVYERYDFFEEAIASAKNQTVACKIIVSDNASSHDRFEIYCNNNNIEYYKNNVNVGIFANWNKCFNYAKTPYVMILGDDDILYPNFVQEFLNAEAKHDGLDFYYTNIDLLVKDKKENWDRPAIYGFFDKSLNLLEFGAKAGIGVPSISGVFNRRVIVDTPLAESYYGSNDWLWLYSNADRLKIFGNDKKLLGYRRHSGQDSTNNILISYFWSYPVIYYIIHEKLIGKSELSKNALYQCMSSAIQALTKLEFRFYDYYHSISGNNMYKEYYKDKISKKSLPLFMMVMTNRVGFWGLKLYFKIYNTMKLKFIIP